MKITERSKNYACPDCGQTLTAAMGDGSDGQPTLWWCTDPDNSIHTDQRKFDPRATELDEILDPTSAATAAASSSPALTHTPDSSAGSSGTTDPSATNTPASSTTSPVTSTSSPSSTVSADPKTGTKVGFTTIPPKKDALKRQFALVEVGLVRARQLLLWGPPGTGKSTIAAMMHLGGRDVDAITLTPETPMFEIRGTQTVKDGTVIWQDGPGIRAWRNGSRLILDEIDQAGPDIMSFLHALLDDKMAAEKKGYTLPSGEIVFPHPNFQVVCTMNGDPDRLPPAIKSRLSINVKVTQPMPAILAAIDEDLRAPALNSIIDGKTGAREWLNVCQLRRDLTNEDGFTKSLAHETAGTMVFGDGWKEMIGDIKIGNAKDPK